MGNDAYTRGFPDEAITYYRQALDHDPNSARIRLGLAVALLAQQKFDEAIQETEEAYERDLELARYRLIDVRLQYARKLKLEANDEGALEQAGRILEVDQDHEEARQLVCNILLTQAEDHLSRNEFNQALDSVNKLAELIPITRETNVSRRIRQLWLDYNERMTQQEQPDWDGAREVLSSLEPWGLLDETTRTKYNQATLHKAQTYLEEDGLEPALNALRNELKQPLPERDIKDMLLGYGYRQIGERRWEWAEATFAALCEIVADDEEPRAAQSDFYHQWGDTLLEAQDFDTAIEIYGRGKPAKEFKPKIVESFLRKAARHLERHQLSEAEASYQEALEIQKNKKIKAEARQELVSYFHSRREDQHWARASRALEILKTLKLAQDEVSALETSLHLDQVEAELAQSRLDNAFQHMDILGNGAEEKIKTLVRDYIRHKARQREWEDGADALKRLSEKLPEDQDTIDWLANWQFLWARDISSEHRFDRNPAQAKALCYETLSLTRGDDTPYIDLLGEVDPSPDQETISLQRSTCALLTDILLEEAESCLDDVNLPEAQARFEEAQELLSPPEDLDQRILDSLYTSHEQLRHTERWKDARSVLELTADLKVNDAEIDRMLEDITRDQVHELFKDDRLDEVFEFLHQLGAEATAKEQRDIKTEAYLFSRLYAGQNRWDDARDVLRRLNTWLGELDSGPDEEITGWLDDSNREHLDFVRSRRQPEAVPEAEQIRRVDEFMIAEAGYQDAKDLELNSLETWSDDVIQAGMILGQTHLDNDNLPDAVQVYQTILDVESRRIDHQEWIIHNLHNYNDRVLAEENWDQARQAIEHLKSLDLEAPSGRTWLERRADGALQRVALSQAGAWLEEHQLGETFNDVLSLSMLPPPRPQGAVKAIIKGYSLERCDQDDWPRAVESLRRLNRLLKEDSPRVRDNEALNWLVECLEGWGQRLEKNDDIEDLKKAAAAYRQAFKYTCQTAIPRNYEVAAKYIRVTMELAQNRLDRDPLESETHLGFKHAIRRYRIILSMKEHSQAHETGLNEALHDHATRLADAGQWSRAHQVLDELNSLYPDGRNEYRLEFASRRRDLTVREVRERLDKRQLGLAFDCLNSLKEEWLPKYDVPQVTWLSSQYEIKTLVHDDYCEPWMEKHEWELAAKAVEGLASLLPGDEQVCGWQVDTRRRWGEWWLREQDRPEEAQARFEEALDMASGQGQVSVEHIEAGLLETAQRYLKRNNLDAAVAVYQLLLEKCGTRPQCAEKIGRALKDHSDRLATKKPPEWRAAHLALDRLRGLGLDDRQAFRWRQQLSLREMKAWLHQNDLDAAFASLKAMEHPWPLADIQKIVEHYSQSHVGDDKWEYAIQALARLGELVAEESSAREWVVNELGKLGRQLDKSNKQAAEQAYERSLSLQRSS